MKQKKAPQRRPKKVEKTRLDFEITYKNYQELSRFTNDRAKISGQKRSGITAKQQRKVTREIKRARHLGLLPFKPSN